MTESSSPPPRPRGHVEATPEARPLPPAWRDHFQGPIPGLPPAPTPAAASAGGQAAGQPNQPAPVPNPPAAPAPPPPAFQPEANRPIPLYGDRQERPGGERQEKSGWDAADLLKPLAAGAALLAVVGVRLAVRGVAQLADALGNRRRSS
ncbi:MAG TPA: hypothetical protein VFQ80_10940 [Thermomicrobiales bacterium]|nr:hypothetical protein [Thermomicrobiales bacterium]